MKTLYFYSHNDGIIRHASIDSVKQVVGIVNELYEEEFLSFLALRVSILKNHDFKHYLNRVSSKSIRMLLDAAGHPDKYVSNGEELNKLLLKDVKELFTLGNHDALLAKYLIWLMESYIKIFNNHYGKLILIVSNSDDINPLPCGFKPITFKPDKRVFYSQYDEDLTRKICARSGIKIKKEKLLSLYPTAFLIACSQLILQGADFLTDIFKF